MNAKQETEMAARVAALEIEKMAAKGGEDQGSEALNNIDAAADSLVAALRTFDENLSAVKPETPEQKKAVKEMQDILETALTPYASDFLEQLEAFDEEGE